MLFILFYSLFALDIMSFPYSLSTSTTPMSCMLHFLSRINNHSDLSEHCSNVEEKEKLDDKMVEWGRILRDGEGAMKKMV
jgi:hypothetical protein